MTLEHNYGGILARFWNINATGWTRFAEGPYFLYRYLGKSGDEVACQELQRFTAFSPPENVFVGEGWSEHLRLQADELWLAGVRKATEPVREALVHVSEPYKVQKPWGAEFWLSGKHPDYCFKQIHIRQGHRTSLQLHHSKRETNVLVSGKLRLHFRSEEAVISSVEIEAPVSLEIQPNCVHRMEALTDLNFLEISTPEVDDVVRLADDTGRPDGRIETEHRR